MANNQQTTHNMPIYKNADFSCNHCDSVWQANYTDIAALRANQSVKCQSCHCELTMNDDERQIINQRFEHSEKVSKRAICFTIPYFILCAAIGMIYGGIATTVMIVIGFMIIITIRSSLTKDGIDHFHLNAINPPQKKHNTNKASNNKKRKKSK